MQISTQPTSIQIGICGLALAFSILGALFGRRRYGYSYPGPAAGCCGCCAVAIMLPIAIIALKMLAKMYGAYLQ